MKTMKKYRAGLITIILGVTLIFSGSCALRPGTATKFYMLSAINGPASEKQAEKEGKCKTIGIGPLQLPAYLDRPQIVTRINPNEIKLAELDNWAEPLKDNVISVLVENISQLICTEAVVVFPWKKSLYVDYQIDMKIVRMDGRLGEKAVLAAQWAIIDASDKSVLLMKKSEYAEPVTEPTYSALVAAHSRLMATISRDIAQAVESLSN